VCCSNRLCVGETGDIYIYIHTYIYIDKHTEQHETYIYKDINISHMYIYMSKYVCLPRNGRHIYMNIYIYIDTDIDMQMYMFFAGEVYVW